MYLIIGSTGHLGSEVCSQLRSAGKPFRAFVRVTSNQTTVGNLRDIGAEIVYGDLKDNGSIADACEGIATVISTASSLYSHQPGDSIDSVDLAGQKSLIKISKKCGVNRFIFVSLSRHHKTDCPLTAAKRSVEWHLQHSRLNFTIIRPVAFMEFWLNPSSGFDFNRNKATIFGSGKSKISFVSIKDVAKFILVTLDNPKSYNSVIELGGPNAVSYLDAVNYFQLLSGRKFLIRRVGEDTLIFQKKFATNAYLDSIVSQRLDLIGGSAVDMHDTLSKYPINLMSLQDYALNMLNGKEK